MKLDKPHIAITIIDLQATKEFYSSIGFTLSQEFFDKKKGRTMLFFSGYGIQIEAFHFNYGTSCEKAQNDNTKIMIQHFALPVNNLEKQKTLLIKKNISLFKDISIASIGLKYLYIMDPNGFIIEFFEKTA